MKRAGVSVGSPAHMPEAKIAPYEAALRFVGVETVRIRPGDPIPEFDGLLLTGGTDVDPGLYGQPKGLKTQEPDIARDAIEQVLLAAALASGRPVLGICRGLQAFNVHLGGTLHQHIEGHQQIGVDNAHAVEVAAETCLRTTEVKEIGMSESWGGMNPAPRIGVNPNFPAASGDRILARIIGAGRHEVNSRHHQAVDRLGAGLIVSARSEDGIVEAFELPGHPFAVAVQWHPEDRIQIAECDLRLFQAFAATLSS